MDHDNNTCELSPHGDDEIVGGRTYRAEATGRAVIRATVDESIEEIKSVSVRLASDMSLLASADTTPDK